MREIGILLLAFTPLDVSLSDGRTHRWIVLLAFMILGAALFCGALILERRSRDAD